MDATVRQNVGFGQLICDVDMASRTVTVSVRSIIRNAVAYVEVPQTMIQVHGVLQARHACADKFTCRHNYATTMNYSIIPALYIIHVFFLNKFTLHSKEIFFTELFLRMRVHFKYTLNRKQGYEKLPLCVPIWLKTRG